MIGNNENVIISHEIGFASLVFMKVEHEIYAKEVSMNLILLIIIAQLRSPIATCTQGSEAQIVWGREHR